MNQITQQIHEVDWSLDLPANAVASTLHGVRRRRTRRRRVGIGVVGVTVAAIATAVPLLSSSIGAGSDPGVTSAVAPQRNAFSQIPPVTLARLHRAGYVITAPTSSPTVSRQQALETLCHGQSLTACGDPTAYLVNMRDDYAHGTNPVAKTYWVIAFPPEWRPMLSCGPYDPSAQSRHGPCLYYGVIFDWVDARTGALGDEDGLSVKVPPEAQGN